MTYINFNSAKKEIEMLSNFNNDVLNYLTKKEKRKINQANNLILNSLELEEILNKNLELNQKIKTKFRNSQTKVPQSMEEIINIFKLRSEVFKKIGYNSEFKEKFKGLNYDIFDKNSINIYIQNENKKIIGTSRIILDSKKGLQSENKFDKNYGFMKYRKKSKNKIISEISRTTIRPENRGTPIFKYLFQAKYDLVEELNIGNYLSCLPKEMYERLYSKFGVEVIKEIPKYGNIQKESVILSWPTTNFSKFFKKVILNKK